MFAIKNSNNPFVAATVVATVADMEAARAYFADFFYSYFEEDADHEGCADCAAQKIKGGELVIYTVEPVKG